MGEADGEVVRRAQSGDLDAFERLVEAHQDAALAYAFGILGDYHAAEDAAQEAFVAVWRYFGTLRKPEAFGGWLRRVVRTQCNRATRRKRVPTVTYTAAGDVASPEPSPLERVENHEVRLQVHEAIAGLTQVQREGVSLYYLSGWKQREIARALGVSVTAVQKRLHDARGKLRERMIDMAGDRENADSRREKFRKRVIEKVQTVKFGSTVMGTLYPALQATGRGPSWARMMGTLGHAFAFSMRKGCGEFWWEGNIDWWLFFGELPHLGFRFDHFQAIQNRPRYKQPLTAEQLASRKLRAWECVCASIDRGVPAVAWAPITPEQKESGVGGMDWGLLVGYDPSKRTYTARHAYSDNVEYEVPYDGFGCNDSAHWYYVIVPGEPVELDPVGAGLGALRNALDWAKGTRYDREDACYDVDAEGYAAYELWRSEVESANADPRWAPRHPQVLADLRGPAAEYLEELRHDFPRVCDGMLAEGAKSYRDEVALLEEMVPVCQEVRDAGRWDDAHREHLASLIDGALEAERNAVASVEQIVMELDATYQQRP